MLTGLPTGLRGSTQGAVKGSLRARSANASIPIAASISWAVRSCSRVCPAVLAAQALTVEQVRAGELGAQMSPAAPLDRFPVQFVGGSPVEEI